MRSLLIPATCGGMLLPPLQATEVLGCRFIGVWAQLPTCLQSLTPPHLPGCQREKLPVQPFVSVRQQQQQLNDGRLVQQHARVPSSLLQQLAMLGHRVLSAPQQQLLRKYHTSPQNQVQRDIRIDRYSPPEQSQQRQQQQQRWKALKQRQTHRTQGQKQHPQQTDSTGTAAAAWLTHRLSSAQSPDELIKLFVQNVESINHVHVIAALTRAATLWDNTGLPAAATTYLTNSTRQQHQETDVQRQQVEQLLKHLSGPFTRGMPYYGGREISSGLWAYARCRQPVPDQLITAAAQQLSSWDTLSNPATTTQHLVNLSWAAATLGCQNRQLYSAVAAAAQQKLAEMTASQVSVLAWTLARAGVREQQLMEGLASRAKLLLEQQLQYLQQQSAGGQMNKGGKRSRIHAAQLRFAPGGLAGLSYSFGAAWKWHDAALLSAVAAVSSQVPLRYDFKPHEAANLLKGLAVAAGAADVEAEYSSGVGTTGSIADGSAGSTAADADEPGTDIMTAQPGVSMAAAAAAATAIDTYWSSAVAVATAVLRRQDEAQASSFGRILWALAELQGYRQQISCNAPAATAAGSDGSSVFEQTCTAVQRCWQHQPAEPQTVLLTVWALVQAQHNGLIQPLLLPSTAVGSCSSAAGRGALSPSQQLLHAVSEIVVALANQDLMKPQQLADMAAAYVKLQQHSGIKLLPTAAATTAQGQQSEDVSPSSSNNGHGQEMPHGQQETAPLEQEVAMAVKQQLEHWPAGSAANVPGQQALAAAVHAVAGAAERVAAAEELRLQDAVRLMAALSNLLVQRSDVFQKLLAQLTSERLHGCDNETLVAAARAVISLTRHQPELLLQQAQPVDLLGLLLGLCLDRWGAPASAGGLDDSQRSKIRRALKQTGLQFRQAAAVVQLSEVAGAV